MSKHEVKDICKMLVLETFEESEEVFSLGSIGDKFYIVLTGEIGVYILRKNKD